MTELSGAVDLGALSRPQNHKCTIVNGCNYNLTAQAPKHESLEDCVRTAVAYADTIAGQAIAMEQELQVADALSARVRELTTQVSTLIGANRRFQDDLQDREEQVRTLKRIISDKVQEGSHGQGEGNSGT